MKKNNSMKVMKTRPMQEVYVCNDCHNAIEDKIFITPWGYLCEHCFGGRKIKSMLKEIKGGRM